MLWLATTVALAVAVPAEWAQRNLVDENGYTVLAQKAAGDPALQSAMAGELTTRAMALIAEHGGGRYPVDSSQVHDAAAAFTAGPSFPPQFAAANRAAHRWLFADATSGDSWAVDVAPMLNDSAFEQILSDHNVKVPATLTVPLTVSVPHSLRQGELSRVATWGSWASLGAAVLCGVWALLTLLVARRRGKALTSWGSRRCWSARPGGWASRSQAATSTKGSTAPPAISDRSRTSWCTTPRPACANGWTWRWPPARRWWYSAWSSRCWAAW